MSTKFAFQMHQMTIVAISDNMLIAFLAIIYNTCWHFHDLDIQYHLCDKV